ncbi:MAG: sigma-70 family RNA polymerase sigma factor [Desulfobacteraceae bacterium]|jgi:RNA polymerase sigma-32 factor|nr:MAG: sigma-70 family RNA polymerase sigma factor [Desulfobacteraceae bacterium]
MEESEDIILDEDAEIEEGDLDSVAGVEMVPAIPLEENRAVIPYDPLQIYLMEIKRYKLLTREEEMELAIRAVEQQDEKAIYTLVTSNLRLVVKIAMDFHRYWTQNLLDLIQEGNLGLIQAVRKFDPYRGIKFSYYASFWIKAYLLKFIMDNWKLVKIGTTQSQRKLFFNLAKERESLISKGFEPEPRLLAERLDVKEEEVVEMSQRLGGWEISLSSPLGDDSKETYGAFLPDPSTSVEEELSQDESRRLLKEKLKEFRKTMTGKEADIFDNRIMAEKPLTLRELGEKYNISRERVRQLQEKIVDNIRKWLEQEIPNFKEQYTDMLK